MSKVNISIGKVDIDKEDEKFYIGFLCGVMTTTDALQGVIVDKEDCDTLYEKFWEFLEAGDDGEA